MKPYISVRHHRATVLIAAAVAFAVLLVAPSTPAQEEESEGPQLDASLEMAVEYDDNITLGADTVGRETAVDDVVFHARPDIDFTLPFGTHLVSLESQGDFRRGTDSDLDEYNLFAAGRVDFRFENGFAFRLYDSYNRTSFDQAIYFAEDEDIPTVEPGISETQSNTYGVATSYARRNAFRFDAFWERGDEEYDLGAEGPTSIDERESETIGGRLSVPLSTSFLGYLDATVEDQESPYQITRVFDDERYVAGLIWRRSDRLTFTLEAGHEEIDFADTPEVDNDNFVALLTGDFKVSERTHLSATVGRDGFGKSTWEVFAERKTTGGSIFRLRGRKLTQASYSLQTVGPTFRATIGSAQWQRRYQRILAKAELGYFILESQVTDAVQEEDTAVAVASVSYDLTRWLDIGSYYRYGERTSNNLNNEFENHRFGVFATVHTVPD